MATTAITTGVRAVNSKLPRRFEEVERVSRRVVLAVDALTGRPVAVKTGRPPGAEAGAASTGSAKGSILELAREAALLAACAHPGIPKLVDFGFTDDGHAWLAMERAEGERPVGPMALQELAALADGTCEVLEHLHARGLVHRDLKADNVRDAGAGSVVVLDLGLASPPGHAPDARGTPGHVAPEALERREIDARTDLYALGAMLYEAATGKAAFPGGDERTLALQRQGLHVPLARLRPDLPRELAYEIEAMLEADPERRPASAAEARTRIARALGTVPGQRVLAPELVGRDAASTILARTVEASRLHLHAARVVVDGSAGSGRTRLLETLRARLVVEGVPMLVRSAGVASLHPLQNFAEDLALAMDMESAAAAGHEPGASARRMAGEDEVAPIVAEALDGIDRAVRGLAEKGWRRSPLVLAFDDCDRADEATRADLDALARRVSGPVVVLLAGFPESSMGVEGSGRRAGDAVLTLAPLGRADARELVASALRATAVRQEPDGVPELPSFTPDEALQPGALLDALEREGLGRRCHEGIGAGSGSVALRAVSEEACRLGAALVIVGLPVSPESAASIAGLDGDAARLALDELVASGRASVVHGAIVAGAALLLDPVVRRRCEDGMEMEMHDRVVERWAEVAADLPPAEAEALRLEHVALGSEPLEAARASATLADDAMAHGLACVAREAVQGGLARVTTAGRSPARDATEAALRNVAGRLAERAGDQVEAASEHERAVECAARAGEGADELRSRASVDLARVRGRSGDFEAARALLEAVASPGSRWSDAARAELADLHLRAGNLDECARWIERCDGEAGARLVLARARLLAATGEAARAASTYEEAIEVMGAVGRAGEPDGRGGSDALPSALSELGRLRLGLGDAQGALEAWTEALAASETAGDPRAEAEVRDALAQLLADQGRPFDAAAHSRRAARAWSRAAGADPARGAGHSRSDAARAAACLAAGREALRAGEVQAAIGDLEAASRLVLTSSPRLRAEALLLLGSAQSAAAEQAEALANCEEALVLATDACEVDVQARAATALGRIYGAFGSTRDGMRWQRRALALAEGAGPSERCAARVELAALLVREGHLTAAEAALKEAGAEAAAPSLGSFETDARGRTTDLAALVHLRLGRVQHLLGELGAAESELRAGLAAAETTGNRLCELEGTRLLGALECDIGETEGGLARLESALRGCLEAGWFAELPAAYEALGRAHLRAALRLRTPTGVVVDRERVCLASSHIEKGLDLTVTTGRMADRASLLALAAHASETSGDVAQALELGDEAHRLALETGDLLVASVARLVKGDALLARREYGVALAEARIACEALARCAAASEEWRAHALLARVQGAWGMARREEASASAAEAILRRMSGSMGSVQRGRTFLADAERQAAIHPGSGDAARARRAQTLEISTERLGGRVDTEDLVEALIAARRQSDDRGFELERTRERLQRSDLRRQVLARLASSAGRSRAGGRETTRVLAGLARAWGAEGVVLAMVDGARMTVVASHGTMGVDSNALDVLGRVAESGAGEAPHRSSRRRRALRAGVGDCEVALPLRWNDTIVGALLLRMPVGAPPLRRADLALLDALAPLLALMVSHRQAPVGDVATPAASKA